MTEVMVNRSDGVPVVYEQDRSPITRERAQRKQPPDTIQAGRLDRKQPQALPAGSANAKMRPCEIAASTS
jgi:hypothetical protein